MAVTSNRLVKVILTGDVEYNQSFNAAASTNSPGQISLVSLTSGANTITPPSGGSSPQAVTILPPSGNASLITLKGVAGDTGVALHYTDPTVIGLNSTTGTFVLATTTSIDGVRLIWT